MSKRLPVLIEPLRLAEKSSLLEGRISLGQMKRVASSLFDRKGDLAVNLQFGMDENRQPNIRGTISGKITLVCQRCMQAMDYTVASKVSLAIVRSDAQATNLPAKYDPLMVDEEGKISLVDLVEDELILALPTVAMHAISDCPAGDQFLHHTDEPSAADDEKPVAQPDKPNPFAVLEQLKKKTGE